MTRSRTRAAERAEQTLNALAPAPGDVVAQRGLPTKALTPLELHALARVGKPAEKVRDLLKVGVSQRVDFTLRVWGSIDVADVHTAMVDEKLDLKEVLAVVLGTLTPPARTAAVEQVIKRLKHPRPEIELSREWLGFVEAIERELTHKVPQRKRGSVTGTLESEVVVRPRPAC